MNSGRGMGLVILALAWAETATAGVGDPQVRTDHPWYPGELACSTFDRLFATQAEVYRRVTGGAARDRRGEGARLLALAEHPLLARRGGGRGPLGQGLQPGRRPADPRVLDRPVRPRLRPVRDDPLPVGRRDGGPARPRPRPGRRASTGTTRSRSSSPAAPTATASGPCSTTTSRPSSSTRRAGASSSIAEIGADLEAADRPRVQARAAARLARLRAAPGRRPGLSPSYQRRRVPRRLRRPAADGPPAPRRDAAPLPAARPGRRQDVRLLGPELQHGRRPRPRAVAHLGQPAGRDARLARAGRATSPARPASPTPSTPTGPTSRPATTGRASSTRTTDHVTFEFSTPLHHRRDAARTTGRGASTSPAAATGWSSAARATAPCRCRSTAGGPGRTAAQLAGRARPDRPCQGHRQYWLRLHAGAGTWPGSGLTWSRSARRTPRPCRG